MNHVKYLVMAAVLLLLAACGQVAGPEVNTELEPLHDNAYADEAGTTTTATINLGSVAPGGNLSGVGNIYVKCVDEQNGKHAARGVMPFGITGTTSELSANASVTIPSPSPQGKGGWPIDNEKCDAPNKSYASVANGTVNLSVSVPSGASTGPRSVALSLTPSDNDVKNTVKITVNYTVSAPAPSDTTRPTVNVVFGLPDGQNDDWFITKPVQGIVYANDTSNVTAIQCTGATVGTPTGIGTGSASAPLTVSAEGISNVSCTATDGASPANSGAAADSSNTRQVKIDTTAPVVTPADVDNTSWHKTDLAQAFEASDAASGLANAADASFTLTASEASTKDAEGNIVPTIVSKTVTDRAGNSTTRSVSAKIDRTAPTIAASAKTADGDYTAGTWTNQDVTVSFTCSDALSGVVNCPAPVVVSADTVAAGQNVLDSVSDNAGNSATSVAFNVKIDKTNPAITFVSRSTPAGTWTNQNVNVNWSCMDDLSGSVAGTASQTVSTEGTNQSATGTCADNAGNTASDTQSGINIDTTKPEVSVTGVTNGAQYTLGSVPTAGCSTTDTLSEVKTNAMLSTTGGSVGSVTATCSGAEDNAGNTNSASVTYNVHYAFGGWQQPVVSLPTRNVVKAGRAIPVKFTLGGDFGLNIFNGSGPVSANISCTTAATDLVEDTLTAGSSSLSYDASTGMYTYVWKSDSAWAGKCRSFKLNLNDGSSHEISFQFTK